MYVFCDQVPAGVARVARGLAAGAAAARARAAAHRHQAPRLALR